MQYFRAAAVPRKYIRVQAIPVQGGRVAIEVYNISPVAVRKVVVEIQYLDEFNQVRRYEQTIEQTLSPTMRTSAMTRLSAIPAEQLGRRVAVRVVRASVAN